MINVTGEHLRLLFGIKLKQLRVQKKMALKDLAARTGMSISYLSEIEKGKKYPKPEKMFLLAQALDSTFDELVALKIGDTTNPLTMLLESPLLQEFPFHLFGIDPRNIIDLASNSPDKVGALIQTLSEITRIYDMRVEHFLFAALRSFQKMHHNYFEDLEQAAERFCREYDYPENPPFKISLLKKILTSSFGHTIDETTLQQYPELNFFRSITVEGKKTAILVNKNLLPSQKAFIYGRELGYSFLNLQHRTKTSTWIKVESFEQVLDNFKASYFGGALLINQNALVADLRKLFAARRWDGQAFLRLMRKYNVTPEMFLYRLSQIIPEHFGLTQLYYLRFNSRKGSDSYELTKELNMSALEMPHGIGLNEHYCRRWPSIRYMQALEQQPDSDAAHPLVGAQRSHYIDQDITVFTITLVRPLALRENTLSSMTIGFVIDEAFQERVKFWDDPGVPEMSVNETCERCPLTRQQCPERVAEPKIYEKEKKMARRAQVLEELLASYPGTTAS